MEIIITAVLFFVIGGLCGAIGACCLASSAVKCACNEADEAKQHEKEAKEQLNRRMAERIFP